MKLDEFIRVARAQSISLIVMSGLGSVRRARVNPLALVALYDAFPARRGRLLYGLDIRADASVARDEVAFDHEQAVSALKIVDIIEAEATKPHIAPVVRHYREGSGLTRKWAVSVLTGRVATILERENRVVLDKAAMDDVRRVVEAYLAHGTPS